MWTILLYLFLEGYTFFKFIEVYSFMDAILLIFTSGVLGIALMSLQGRSVFLTLQKDLAQGQMPSSRVIHRACILFAGLLFLIPGFVSDIFAILLVLPGTRHLFIHYTKKKLTGALKKGRVMFFSNVGGMGGMGGMRGETRSPERDAQVVDVTPLEVTHRKIDPPQGDN